MKSMVRMLSPRLSCGCAAAIVAALIVTVATGHPHAAAPGELFFSEYIEGSSNNKALEIFNGTGVPINLAGGGYNIQMHFNGNPTATLTINLTGTVAPGDVYVLAQSSASAAILAQADQTNGSGWFNGDDAVVLRKGTTAVDVIGQIGFDPGTEWGTGVVSTADNTLRRKPAFCGDPVGADVFSPADEWEGFATDTFLGLGAHIADCLIDDEGPAVSSTSPGNGATDVALNASLSVSFSEPVDVSEGWFTLSCSSSGLHSAAVSGGPSSFTLDPDVDFDPSESCTLTLNDTSVTDQDTDDPPDTLAADYVTSFTTFAVDPCTLPYTAAYAIQGTGMSAAVTGAVTTQGVVVGDYEGPSSTGQLRGFYLQDVLGDGDTSTSDAIFVFNGNNNSVALGDVVRVRGTAGEFQDQTQVGSVTSIASCGSGGVPPVDVELPFPSATFAERFEGMLVRLPQTLTVTEHFQLGRFGQVVLSSGGRLEQPTDVYEPGPLADARQAANNLNRLIIDDGTNAQNPDPIVFARNGLPLSASNTLRGGDTATGVVGVMTYTWAGNSASGNAYRVRPIGALDGFVAFVASNPRPDAAPELPPGAIRVASMNLLNFFNTFTGCSGGVAGAPMDCRGAENLAEFDRQWPKTVAAVVGTNADIVGIVEIENDGYAADSAIAFLVDRLNEATTAGTYRYVDVDARTGQTNALGTDAIKVGLIYQPARVLPIGQTAALNTTTFETGGDGFPRNRPSLAQAFEQFGTGARLVVDVNHLKSKGSACDAPDAGDGQGNCNVVRTNAADELAAWLAGDPTGIGDADTLIIGDLNSYSKEDPIAHLDAAGFDNVVAAFGGGHSYVFDGQWGSLDHALASESLAAQVVGATDLYISADEPSVLDYNTNFKSAGQVASLYAPDWLRMSDHNPLLVDLVLDVDADASSDVHGAGKIVLTNSAGTAAGDGGSDARFGLNVKFKKNSDTPAGHVTVMLRHSEGDETRTYRIRATALTALLTDPPTGMATVVGTATITDVSDASVEQVVVEDATIRLTIDDNGSPGVQADTVGITVWAPDASLWFSSSWDGTQTGNQAIAAGNLHVGGAPKAKKGR